MEHLYTHEYVSPVGTLYLAVDRSGLVYRVSLSDFRPTLPNYIWSNNKYPCGELEYQLDQYFAGQRQTFSVDTALNGTEFQNSVWKRLRKVGYGQTESYAGLARKIGRTHAARAVGRAVGLNPALIVVPCHRVIYSNGRSGNYAVNSVPAQSGRSIKTWLLNLELLNQKQTDTLGS